MLFNIRNIVQKGVKTYKKNMFKICGTTSRRYYIDLDAYISKKEQKQNVPVNAKCYLKEIMCSRCLLFIYLGLHTDYISAFICWFGYSQ